jgi:hypothetical protein
MIKYKIGGFNRQALVIIKCLLNMFVSLSLENRLQELQYTRFEIFLFNMHLYRTDSAVLQRRERQKIILIKNAL